MGLKSLGAKEKFARWVGGGGGWLHWLDQASYDPDFINASISLKR